MLLINIICELSALTRLSGTKKIEIIYLNNKLN
jgi:hypothetical protein